MQKKMVVIGCGVLALSFVGAQATLVSCEKVWGVRPVSCVSEETQAKRLQALMELREKALRAFYEFGDEEGALKLLQGSLEKYPEERLTIRSIQYELLASAEEKVVLNLLMEWYADVPPDKFWGYHDLGQAILVQCMSGLPLTPKVMQFGVDAYREFIEVTPRDKSEMHWSAYSGMAKLQSFLGQLDDAIVSTEKAIELMKARKNSSKEQVQDLMEFLDSLKQRKSVQGLRFFKERAV